MSNQRKTNKKEPIIYAFIDSQNLNLSIQALGWKLDFKRFRVYLKDKYKVEKTFIFIGYVSGNESLYTFLQQTGYIVIFKPTLEYKKGKEKIIKGNVDAELVLHTMIEYVNYDKAIIVASDGDYHCLVEYLIKQKKFLHLIIANPNNYSALLRKFRAYFVYIHQLEKKLAYRHKKARGSNLRTKP